MGLVNIERSYARLSAYNAELIFKNYWKNKYDSRKIEMMSTKCKEIIYMKYCKIYTDGSTDNPQIP